MNKSKNVSLWDYPYYMDLQDQFKNLEKFIKW